VYKNRFSIAQKSVYLDTAAEGLPLPEWEEGLVEYHRTKMRGSPADKDFYRVEAETAEMSALLLGAPPANVALLSSTSAALIALATSLDWKPTDQVIISDLDFPSGVLPWLRLRKSGVEVIVVCSKAGALHWEQFAEVISSRTRLICLSLVSYKTGTYLPFIPKLAAEADRVGAIVCIDATQALGRCPVALDGVDYLMSSTHKWLLGPHGLSIVYVGSELRGKLDPAGIGWWSVENIFTEDRFERYELKKGAACLAPGMPSFLPMYMLRRSITFIQEAGVQKVYEELKPVMARLRQGLVGLGLEVLTPAAPEFASGIVSFAHRKAQQIGALLEEMGVIVWADDGRVRSSVHLYNDATDVDHYIRALQGVLQKVESAHV
jgi:cysteine desulfurase/selenocysteine lyase